MAADPQVTKQDLKGIKPNHHKYLFYTIGGAVLGAGVGALLGGGGDSVGKGALLGGGAMSALYLHQHRHDPVQGWRNWAYVGSYTSLSSGLGWTLCGCARGFGAGALIGAGGSGIWLATHSQPTATAGTANSNNP